jgi:hypothetical protein
VDQLAPGSNSREDFAPVEALISQGLTLTRLAEFVTYHRSTFPSFDTTVATDANNFFVLVKPGRFVRRVEEAAADIDRPDEFYF